MKAPAQAHPYSGFLLAFEPRRTEKISAELSRGHAVESFSAVDWEFHRREIVLLALAPGEPSICGAALMERMHGSGGTGKLKMRIFDAVLFHRKIAADELWYVLDLSQNVSSAERPTRIGPGIWTDLVNTIKQLRPESAAPLDALVAKREEDRRLQGKGERVTRLIEQRDAVGMTLDIAKGDRQSILRSFNPEGLSSAASVLDLLDNEPLHERDVIERDQRIFGELLDDSMRHARFSIGGGRTVRIHVYDKKPLETVLGTDLLIYQEMFRSFLLIQYKNMAPVTGAQGKTWSYLADKQFDQQIGAMERGEIAIRKQWAPDAGVQSWRLHSSPFYLKFCETTRPNARDDSLVRGITLSLEHLRHHVAQCRGAEETRGVRIGYDNCPRYLNNTQFVELAREGWIGCDHKGYEFIRRVLAAAQEGGRQAMMAVVEGAIPAGARARGRQARGSN